MPVLLALAVGLSAVVLACAEDTTQQASEPTEPAGAAPEDEPSVEGHTEAEGEDEPASTGSKPGKDAGTTAKDSGTPAKDAGPPPPVPFTKAEVQSLFNARCAPCHIGGSSAGMSLASDFGPKTIGVASTELPSMKRIAAGNKEQSYLFHKLRGTHVSVGGSGDRMPKNGPPYLSDTEIARIGAFIDGL